MKKNICLLTISSLILGSLICSPLQITYGEETSTVQNVTLGKLLTKAKENSLELEALVDSSVDIAQSIQSYNKAKLYMGGSSGVFLGYTKSGPYYNYIIPLQFTPMDLDYSLMEVDNAINKLSFGIDLQEKQKMLSYQNSNELLTLSKETSALATRKFEIITLLYEKGLASKNEFEKAELEKKIALINYYNAEYDFKISRLAIAQTMNFDPEQEFTVEKLPVYAHDLDVMAVKESLDSFYTSNNSLVILRQQRENLDKKLAIGKEYEELMYKSDYQTLQYNSMKNKKDYATAIMTGKINISTTVTNINNILSQFETIEKQIAINNSELQRNDIKSTHKYGHDYYENELHQNLNKLSYQKIQLQTGLFMNLENLAYYVNY